MFDELESPIEEEKDWRKYIPFQKRLMGLNCTK